MLKLTLALLAVSCWGQEARWRTGYFQLVFADCLVAPGHGGPCGPWNEAPQDGPRVAIDLVNVKTMAQLGIPVPPSTTDHIRITVTNLDPATVKVVIRFAYFEDGEEMKVERTVTRGEAGAVYLHWVKDASRITSPSVEPVQELGVIQ